MLDVGVETMTASVAVTYCASLIRLLGGAGVLKSTLEQTGLQHDVVLDAENRISFPEYVSLWNNGTAQAADPLLGLRAGAEFHPGNLGALASILVAAPNFAAAVQQLIRYEHLLQDGIQTQLYEVDGRAHAAFTCPNHTPQETYHLMEKEVSEALALAKFFLRGVDFKEGKVEVHFQHASVADIREYKNILGDVPIKFNQAQNQLIFDARLLDFSPGFGNEAVFQSVLKEIDQQVGHDLESQVRRLIMENIHQGVPEVKSVAEKFGMSHRTFQRRLSEEGTRYKELVAQVRQDTALDLLNRTDSSISEIAYLVGFTETSTFHQAFKRWTGQSPGEYRKSH